MSLPRRLADDPSAAPWLAERLRDRPAPQPLAPSVRARAGEALAARLHARTRTRALAWSLAAAACAAAALLASGPARAPVAIGGDSGRPRVEREPGAARATMPPEHASTQPLTPNTAATAVPAARMTADELERGARKLPESRRARARPHERARVARVTDKPAAWLTEARAALERDPERTLALIQSHREPGQAVSPEVVELTIRALEAQRALQNERAAAQP